MGASVAILSTILRWVLALVMVSSGVAKLARPGPFRRVVAETEMLPLIEGLVVVAVPVAEVIVGLLLGVGFMWREAGAACALLIVILSAGFLMAARRTRGNGTEASCGCGGVIPDDLPPVRHIGINAVLGAFSLAVAIAPDTLLGFPTHYLFSDSVEWPTLYSGIALLAVAFIAILSTAALSLRSVVSHQTAHLQGDA